MPKLKPLLNIGIGSGDPAGFPGYRPLNPWGRPMPKADRPPPPPRYQLFVELPDKRVIPVGPKASDDFLKPLCAAIEQGIALGTERVWRNPHIVRLL